MNYINVLNDQQFYLTHHQPTDENVKVIETLNDFFEGKLNQSNFRYEKELEKYNLDYSLNSIKRIDKMLLKIKQTLPKYDEKEILLTSYPLNNDMLIHIVSYYLGELVGRVRQEAPIWYSSFRKDERFKHIYSPPFEIMFCEFANSSRMNSSVFFEPTKLVYDTLTTPKQSYGLRLTNVWEGIQQFIPKVFLNDVNLDTPFTHVPVMELGFDRESAFKQLDKKDIAYLQIVPPSWMYGDPLYKQVEQIGSLYKKGKVVWAQIIQANKLLFTTEHAFSCPAEIIYDPTGRTPPAYLAKIASQLFRLKHTIPEEEELVDYAKHITDEGTRMVSYSVPNIITTLPLKTSSIFVWRLHLPNGVLNNAIPILISDETDEVTLLPAKFWDKSYYTRWIEESYFKEDMYFSLREFFKTYDPSSSQKGVLKPSNTELQKLITELKSDYSKSDKDLDFINEGFAKRSYLSSLKQIDTPIGIGDDKIFIIVAVIIFALLILKRLI